MGERNEQMRKDSEKQGAELFKGHQADQAAAVRKTQTYDRTIADLSRSTSSHPSKATKK